MLRARTCYANGVQKPAHLAESYASQWEDAAMADAYPCRPPYPNAVFDELVPRVPAEGFVLDLGCGTGDLARPLAARGLRVLGVDRSAAMVARGATLPGGDAATLTWRVGRAEAQDMEAPALVTAGESFHWFEWSQLPAIPKLVLLQREELPGPWHGGLREIIPRYSTNRDFQPYDMLSVMSVAGHFEEAGRAQFPAQPVTQSVDDYIRSMHSRNGFSLDRLTPEAARAFDEEMRALLTPHTQEGMLTLATRASMVWGAFLTSSRSA